MLFGCSRDNETKPQSQFEDNNYYFLGLKAQKEGNLKEAENLFNKCIKRGTGLHARRSLEFFCGSEDIQVKISSAKSLVEKYGDDKALLMAAKIFSENNEPNLLILNTDKIDIKKADNELVRLRLEAQYKRGDSSFISDFYNWFLQRPVSSEHYKFFCNYIDDVKFDAQKKIRTQEFENEWEKKLCVMNFRVEVYKKNYGLAETYVPTIENIIEPLDIEMTEQLMSDIGKVYLYGRSDSLKSARHFQSEAEKYKGSPVEFYCHFYAGRLFDKTGGYATQMTKSFISAMECVDGMIQAEKDAPISAESSGRINENIKHLTQLKDNALWYLFKTSLKSSIGVSIANIERYVTQITDPYYYDDFFDMLSPLLLTEGKYKEIGDLYKMMKGHASDESAAKYAYIYARLLEEGIYEPKLKNQSGQAAGADELLASEIRAAYEVALDSATDMYYKVMSAERLRYYDFEKERLFCEPRKSNIRSGDLGADTVTNNQTGGLGVDIAAANRTGSLGADVDVEQILNGYAFFGFPEKIYPEWVKLGSPALSIETTINLSKFLRNCSNGQDDFLMQSLRIASKTANYSNAPLTLELLEYVYPKNYEELVLKYCNKYGLQEPVLWALIRSESFFDPDVISSAGAIGLCQLMSFTGEDIAHRLRRSEYDLTDPETNIEFGAYYLDNLIGRLDGSYLDAFFSYNAGISRVRKWKRSSALGFGVKTIPDDLFLETLPYAETREYGRKLVAATEMYEWLWYRH